MASTPTVRAQTVGLVCIADPSTTNCPTAPIVLTGTSGNTLTVAVNIQSSASINGFDIIVKANTQQLQPVSYSLTGTVLGSNILTLANCIEFTGSGCTAQTGPGIVRIAAVALGTTTTAPTTGLLFTVTYNVLASATNIKVGFQTGCATTSSDPDFCVAVVNGANIVPETVQESTGNIGDFSVASLPSTLRIARDGSGIFQVFFASLNGFSGSISFKFTLTPAHRNSPVATLLSSSIINLLPGTSTDEIFGVVSNRVTPFGTYTFTLTAQAGTLTHTITVSISVVKI